VSSSIVIKGLLAESIVEDAIFTKINWNSQCRRGRDRWGDVAEEVKEI
jgi:hypothetical protein